MDAADLKSYVRIFQHIIEECGFAGSRHRSVASGEQRWSPGSCRLLGPDLVARYDLLIDFVRTDDRGGLPSPSEIRHRVPAPHDAVRLIRPPARGERSRPRHHRRRAVEAGTAGGAAVPRALPGILQRAVRGRRLRAARGPLDWTMPTPAAADGPSLSTVRRLKEDAEVRGSPSRHKAMAGLRGAGIRFIAMADGTLAVAKC